MAKAPPEPLLDRILAAARVGENDDWEFKSAKGGFPASLWETYSAMANSAGGTIVLGATERSEEVHLDGVPADKLDAWKKRLWNDHNNRQVISRGLLASDDVRSVELDRRWLLVVHVRPANRHERPVYTGQNPLEGTRKRRHEGDYLCSPEEVRRMFADASDVPADARVLTGFSLDDLDAASIAAYRNRFSASRPGHAWLNLDNQALIEQLGGWRKDREAGTEGLTLAGLLMFGKHQAIISPGAAAAYMVDYRDYRGRRKPEDRWTDRLFPDGTWEANLFQFYQRCWAKLVADLKVPFRLEDGQRIDETPVHVALREAFVNSMIHSDYTVGGGVVIERYEDRYEFGNPGTLLVSEAQLRQGGVSECRNRSLQRMFLMIGGGEQAGSGYARIQEGWRSQHWRAPRLTSQDKPDRVRLDMPMLSLMPDWVFTGLREKLGQRFDDLNERERAVLATALIEGDVSNVRMQDLITAPSADITKLLRGLVAKGLLETDNQRRWTRYSLPSAIAPRRDLFSGPESSGLPSDSSALSPDSSVLPPKGEEWKAAAATIAGKGKVSKEEMEAVISELCQGRFLTLTELASLLNRAAQNLRNKYLTPMVRAGKLRFRYPDQPNRTDQAYTTAGESP